MTTTSSTPPRTYRSLRTAWVPLAALCLAFFVEMVDNTLLTIALPTIGRDLGGGTTALQWVTGAYSLTFGGLLLTAGSAADRLGRRRVLLWGLAAFGWSASPSPPSRPPASSSLCAPFSESPLRRWRRSPTPSSSGSSTTRPCACGR
jgi:MFS family permease